jgi:dihydroxyacetone kinase
LGVEGICLSIIKNLFTSATVHFNSHRDAQVALGIAVEFVVLNPAITEQHHTPFYSSECSKD